MQHDHGGLVAKYLLPCCHESILFDMHYDHVLKKLTFDPTSSVCVCVCVGGGGGGGSAGKIFATILLHAPFPLILYGK